MKRIRRGTPPPSPEGAAGSTSACSSSSLMHHHWNAYWGGSGNKKSAGRDAFLVGRLLFISVLCAVAAVLGVVAFRLLTDTETKLAQTQFESLSGRALVEAAAIASRHRWAGVSMAQFVSEWHPTASDWPFVDFLPFERLVEGVLNSSSGVDMGFAPFVRLHQQAAFEDFAYGVYDKLGFPNSTGTSSFGRGIWAGNSSLVDVPDKRYHDTTAATTYESSQPDLLTPLFRTDEGIHSILMFNTHSAGNTGPPTDRIIACSEERQAAFRRGEDTSDGESKCGTITELFHIRKLNGRHGAALYFPIYPANDPLTVVGYVPTLILMDEMLENVFGDEVSGIDAVFETETKAVTFTVIHGVGHLVGDGDLHDRSYDSKKEWVVLTNEHDFDEGSPTFRLSLYPNDDFRDAYQTRNPRRGAIGSVCIIIFTSLFFFLYDFCVRREFNSSRELLQARRQFMRFVSHEVRTPLNSVCMGLDLVQSDIGKSLGFESATGLLAYLDHTNDETRKTEPTCPPLEVVPEEQTHALTRQRALEWFQLTQEIQSNTQGAVDILNDLLNYDKIEQGTLQLSKETIPVWDLIEKAILEFKLPASSKQIDLRVQFGTASHNSVGNESFGRAQELPEEARDLKVIGDSLRITQVIRNLMSNALKFTAEGGYVEVKAVYETDEADNARRVAAQEIKLANNQIIHAKTRGFLKVVVSDNGAGMSPDEVERLFNEGVQFNPNTLQAGQGSGLGLFIAKGIVKQHQGVLSASSSGHGKGTQFTVMLPLWRVVEERESNRTAETSKEILAHVSTASNSTTSLRILVVDDSASNRKMLRRLLENKGHRCDEAADGAVAVRMIQKAFGGDDDHPYDTVLMDYEMPECDGPTAAQKVRALGIGVYMVGITGNVLPEDVNHFKHCGVNEVMAKPVKLPDLESLWMEYGIYDGDHH